MENKEVDLSCPCMPQCPNYGKCRECIAAHAQYYTVPHCIKKMQEDMKKNHYHPSNPHIKKTLPERVTEYYENNPGSHLRTVAETLKITEWQLLDALTAAVEVPVSDFDVIYNRLCELESVMLHVDTGSVLLQLTTKLPEAIDQNGMKIVKQESGEMSLTSLLFKESFYAMFLVRETLYGGKESLSLALVGESEKIALSIYFSKSKELFEELWKIYNK